MGGWVAASDVGGTCSWCLGSENKDLERRGLDRLRQEKG